MRESKSKGFSQRRTKEPEAEWRWAPTNLLNFNQRLDYQLAELIESLQFVACI